MIDLRKGCEEAVGSIPPENLVPVLCRRPADHLVLSERGKVIYLMCKACADHNVKNRGAAYVESDHLGRFMEEAHQA